MVVPTNDFSSPVAADPALAAGALLLAQGCPNRFLTAVKALYHANNLPHPNLDLMLHLELPEPGLHKHPVATFVPDEEAIYQEIGEIEEASNNINQAIEDAGEELLAHSCSISPFKEFSPNKTTFNENYYSLASMEVMCDMPSNDVEDWFDEDFSIHVHEEVIYDTVPSDDSPDQVGTLNKSKRVSQYDVPSSRLSNLPITPTINNARISVFDPNGASTPNDPVTDVSKFPFTNINGSNVTYSNVVFPAVQYPIISHRQQQSGSVGRSCMWEPPLPLQRPRAASLSGTTTIPRSHQAPHRVMDSVKVPLSFSPRPRAASLSGTTRHITSQAPQVPICEPQLPPPRPRAASVSDSDKPKMLEPLRRTRASSVSGSTPAKPPRNVFTISSSSNKLIPSKPPRCTRTPDTSDSHSRANSMDALNTVHYMNTRPSPVHGGSPQIYEALGSPTHMMVVSPVKAFTTKNSDWIKSPSHMMPYNTLPCGRNSPQLRQMRSLPQISQSPILPRKTNRQHLPSSKNLFQVFKVKMSVPRKLFKTKANISHF